MESVYVRLDAFEGPFDLLFHLIEKNEIDIYDIPIAILADQFLDHIHQGAVSDMEFMSEFLVMASTLLEIKSKMLLPNKKTEAPEEDPREALVRRLMEYKRYKAVSDIFMKREQTEEKHLYKQENLLKELAIAPEETLEDVLSGVTLEKMFQVFQETLLRRENRTDKIRSGFSSVKKDFYTVEDKMNLIQDLLLVQQEISFGAIFRDDTKKIELIVTFLALLELMKQRAVKVMQRHNFDEIYILRNSEGNL